MRRAKQWGTWFSTLAILIVGLIVLMPLVGRSVLARTGLAPANRAQLAAQRVTPTLTRELQPLGLRLGDPLFVRIYKAEAQLQIWMKHGQRFVLFKRYPICTFSGTLGPKVRQGDGQAPEGFYSVGLGQLNPFSSYHLSFNLGYPNAYDRAWSRTGSALMVHGNCVSIGCYAMGDDAIEEIYTLLEAALRAGQGAVPVHIFPFAMTDSDDARFNDPNWGEFWRNLREGHDWFEHHGVPPRVRVRDRQYVFSAP